MTESSDALPSGPDSSPTPTTAAELAEVITELEQYRERLVNDTLDAAKRAKMMKATVMAQLEPELAQIDATLQNLRDQQTALIAQN